MHRQAARATGHLLVAVVALGLTSGIATAHSLSGTRFTAPLPLPLLFGGAAATVGLTALWLAVTGRRTDGVESVHVATISGRITTTLATVARLAFLVVVVAVIVIGMTGRQVRAENLATVFTWPVWFRGLALVAIFVGSSWRVLSPWRTVYDALSRLEGRRIAALGRYPDRLGEWPSLVGFVLIVGVLDNLTVVPDSPRLTAVVVASYGLWMLGGALAFGDHWLERADPLGVLYRLLGRVAPVRIVDTDDGTPVESADEDGVAVELVPPWTGCRRTVASLSLAVFVVATVYTVSFDGFTSTRSYQRLLFDVGASIAPTVWVGLLLYLVGFLGFVGAYIAAVAFVERLGRPGDRVGSVFVAARRFAATLLPIAATYEVAHNYPFVFRNLGQLWFLVVSPIYPAAEPISFLAWLSLPGFWASQVVLIVLGHVVAVVAAHSVAVDRYPSVDRAKRAHLPLVVVMVGYTVLSLWIVSRPVVQ